MRNVSVVCFPIWDVIICPAAKVKRLDGQVPKPIFDLRLLCARKIHRVVYRRGADIRKIPPRYLKFCFFLGDRRKLRRGDMLLFLLHGVVHKSALAKLAYTAAPRFKHTILFGFCHPICAAKLL